jgi:hypothetical protein
MKKIFIIAAVILLASCSKEEIIVIQPQTTIPVTQTKCRFDLWIEYRVWDNDKKVFLEPRSTPVRSNAFGEGSCSLNGTTFGEAWQPKGFFFPADPYWNQNKGIYNYSRTFFKLI